MAGPCLRRGGQLDITRAAMLYGSTVRMWGIRQRLNTTRSGRAPFGPARRALPSVGAERTSSADTGSHGFCRKYPARAPKRRRLAGAAGSGRSCVAGSGRWIHQSLDVVGAGRAGHQTALPRLDARPVLADDQHARHGSRDGRHLRPAVSPGAQYLPAIPDCRVDRLAAAERDDHRGLRHVSARGGRHSAGADPVFDPCLSQRLPQFHRARP